MCPDLGVDKGGKRHIQEILGGGGGGQYEHTSGCI